MIKPVYLAFLLWLPLSVLAQKDDTTRVLFVGNSYTYFWNLPQQVATLAAFEKIHIHTQQSTSGGVNLGQHWRGDKALQTRRILREGSFDIVILQDHSRRAIEAPDSLLLFGEQWAAQIRGAGARPYLYLTWAREWNPYMQQPITQTYRELARRTDAVVVPVGPAWMRALELRPDLPLYDPDGSHPSPTGSYLTACVMYAVLTGQSPLGLPERIRTTDADGEVLYLNIQSPENARFCQEVAREIVQDWNP